MSRIFLTLDSATDICSVALCVEGSYFIATHQGYLQHSENILLLLDEVKTQSGVNWSDLDCIGFGCGPGSFTGIRLAASVVQGMAFANQTPIVGISSLQALAQAAYRRYNIKEVVACLDARMKEIYWGVFKLNADNIMEAVGPLQVHAPTEIEKLEPHLFESLPWVGNGVAIYKLPVSDLTSTAMTPEDNYNIELPDIRMISELTSYYFQKGQAKSPDQALPLYIRDTI